MIGSEYEVKSGSAYRVKFEKKEFLEMVRQAQPRMVYKVRNMYFFSFDGFVIYTDEVVDTDFSGKRIMIMEAIEFSNEPWQKR